MSNQCKHDHLCIECGKPYECSLPECVGLPGPQGLCSLCSYLHGWARAKDAEANDWSAL